MKQLKLAIALASILVMTGCATPKGNSAPHIAAKKLSNEAYMVGRISLHDQKTGAQFGHGIMGYTVIMGFVADINGKEKAYNISLSNIDDGFFAVNLKPGSYKFEYATFTPGLSRPLTQNLWGRGFNFQGVELASNEIVYVGDIHFEILTKSFKEQMDDSVHTTPAVMMPVETLATVVGYRDNNLEITISDNYEAAVSHFQERNNLPAEHYKKSLLTRGN